MENTSSSELAEGLVAGEDNKTRCWWCASDEQYRQYHDDEWGRPVHDDRRLFEKLSLEGFQAGLSWLTILRKRENFRAAFDNFEYQTVARYDEDDVERLLQNAGIVRHRLKIEAVINNAQMMASIVDEHSSFSNYVWRFRPDASTRPTTVTRDYLYENTTSPESKALAKDLKKRGFRFVGPTTAYSFMQSMGLVNDHIAGCHVQL